LGNAEKREFYDSTSGVENKIKSKAYRLTEKNFDAMVLEGKDVWII
jgi:hypothetical protein